MCEGSLIGAQKSALLFFDGRCDGNGSVQIGEIGVVIRSSMIVY